MQLTTHVKAQQYLNRNDVGYVVQDKIMGLYLIRNSSNINKRKSLRHVCISCAVPKSVTARLPIDEADNALYISTLYCMDIM